MAKEYDQPAETPEEKPDSIIVKLDNGSYLITGDILREYIAYSNQQGLPVQKYTTQELAQLVHAEIKPGKLEISVEQVQDIVEAFKQTLNEKLAKPQ